MAIQLLEKAVNINSGTMNLEGVKEVGMLFKDQFDQIEMDTKWIDMSNLNRAGHLFAETKGSKGKRILLIGHLDTVFPKNSPFQKMERLSDSMAKGPGTNDMKGGNVILLYALKALHDAGELTDAQIIVALTGDEELTGKPISLSRKDLIEAGQRSDIALGFENSTGFKDVTGVDFTYDVNGNMITDGNKGILSIQYNHLNLPTKVFMNSGRYIDYKYDAAGMKLEKIVTEISLVLLYFWGALK